MPRPRHPSENRRAAATLVARGLLKQTQDPSDGRARLLRLTRKGATMHEGAIPLALQLESQLSEGLSRSEWAALRKALVRLTAHVDGIGGGEAPGLEE